jgi:UV DNA damage repair endonuclease
MILSKNTNNIGYVSSPSELSNREYSCVDLLDFIVGRAERDSNLGLSITCIEIPSNFIFPDFSNYDDSGESDLLLRISRVIRSGQRLFFYLPSYFFLGSQIPDVVEKTRILLVNLARFLEMVGISYRSIGLRVGSAYGMRKVTMKRFCNELLDLGADVAGLVTVMNDEKPSLFSVTDLLSGVYYETHIPITFRFLAHSFNSGNLSYREAIFLSSSTWEKSGIPVVIHSESSEVDDDGFFISPIPSDFLEHRIPTFGLCFDCVIESNGGEKSCLKYMSECNSLRPMVINKISRK